MELFQNLALFHQFFFLPNHIYNIYTINISLFEHKKNNITVNIFKFLLRYLLLSPVHTCTTIHSVCLRQMGLSGNRTHDLSHLKRESCHQTINPRYMNCVRAPRIELGTHCVLSSCHNVVITNQTKPAALLFCCSAIFQLSVCLSIICANRESSLSGLTHFVMVTG